ncbi:MAG: Strongly-conserved Zn-finger binding protein (TFIIIA) [Cirrosporium novae-zelandiae]|nr:MAG: Strongly-conserved Zn-finger binding protein (TFIIIA) [Cirrosporium novae-zelandiae]
MEIISRAYCSSRLDSIQDNGVTSKLQEPMLIPEAVEEMMASISMRSSKLKRKADDGFAPTPKRMKGLSSNDMLVNDKYSNSEYEDSDNESISSAKGWKPTTSTAPTPITPCSPSTPKHKYPSDEKTHRCRWQGCSKAFNRPARLAEHMHSHTGERPFKCLHPGCDKDFLRETHLNHHIKSAHTDIRDFVCSWEGCDKKFLTATRLRRHEAAHQKKETYRCTEYLPCNETFRKHATLQRHITSVHLHQKPFPCTKIDFTTGKPCTQAFDTAGKLRSHEDRLHGGSRFICMECSPNALTEEGEESNESPLVVAFPTYSLLQDHLRTVHPPTCPTCSLQCSSSRDLRRHIEITHGDQDVEEHRIHICSFPECGHRFTKKGNLNVHIRTVHAGEKNFVCGITGLNNSKKVTGWNGEGACGRAFASKLSLEEHVRSQHQGLKRARQAKKEEIRYQQEEQQARLEAQQVQDGPTQPLPAGVTCQKTNHADTSVSAIAKLTGANYIAESGRTLPCRIPECQFVFHRMYDLEGHLRSWHGLGDVRIEDALVDASVEDVHGFTRAYEVAGKISIAEEIETMNLRPEAEQLSLRTQMSLPTAPLNVHEYVSPQIGLSTPLAAEGSPYNLNKNSTAAHNGDGNCSEDMGMIDPLLRFLRPEA